MALQWSSLNKYENDYMFTNRKITGTGIIACGFSIPLENMKILLRCVYDLNCNRSFFSV